LEGDITLHIIYRHNFEREIIMIIGRGDTFVAC